MLTATVKTKKAPIQNLYIAYTECVRGVSSGKYALELHHASKS